MLGGMVFILPREEATSTMKKSSRFTLYRIVIIGLMAAMVFVCTEFLGIRIATPTGTTQLKTANAICLLTGILFGGWTGGLAAGIGSAMFDLTFPEYAATAWLTGLFFFAMGGICGAVAHSGGKQGKSTPRNIVATILGAGSYWVLYIGKSIVTLMLSGSVFSAAVIATVPKMITASINAVFAVVVANLLAALLRPKLEQAGVFRSLNKK